MQKTYKYRLYPSKNQVNLFNNILQICKKLYNSQIEYERYIYAKEKRFANTLELNNLLPDLKITNPEFKEVYAQVLQNVNDRITKAFKKFFGRVQKGEKAGYPRFKSICHSFTYPQLGFKLTNKLKLGKIGEIPIKFHREIKGKIKTLTILKTNTNKWFACFCVEQDIKPKKRGNKSIGVDLGISNFATLTNNQTIENPKHLKNLLNKLKQVSKQFSKKQKGSKNKNKARLRLAKLYERIHNQRLDFLHKTTRNLVNNYDCIALEDLKPSKMKNKYLQLSINDASWYKFRQLLSYKAEEAGVRLEFVNPRNTSQRCSKCKKIVKKKLSERIHICPYCNLSIDRDLNASINILNKSSFISQIPLGQGESTSEKLFQ
jgi:putative transposase